MSSRGLACATGLLWLAGCSSYEAPASLDQIEAPLARFDLEEADLRLSVVSFVAKEPAKHFLGVDPAKLGAVPLMIEFENRSGEPLKLVPSSLVLNMEGGVALPPLDIDEA